MFTIRYADDVSPASEPVAHMQTARKQAAVAAAEAGRDVLILRNGQPVLTMHPDGIPSAAPGAKTNCTVRTNPGRPCFCPVCRAVRREDRR